MRNLEDIFKSNILAIGLLYVLLLILTFGGIIAVFYAIKLLFFQ